VPAFTSSVVTVRSSKTTDEVLMFLPDLISYPNSFVPTQKRFVPKGKPVALF
jgi:hypothetical protein